MIVMGGIVGAGIFANPSEVAHRVHTPLLILGVWMLGGLLAICGAFIWAELATRLPGAAVNTSTCATRTILRSRSCMDGDCFSLRRQAAWPQSR